jgi:hypothetical protein
LLFIVAGSSEGVKGFKITCPVLHMPSPKPLRTIIPGSHGGEWGGKGDKEENDLLHAKLQIFLF